jgi:hypothetical protein
MLKRKVQISGDALAQEIAGETVILDLASSTYFGIDETGTRIWQLLKEGMDLQQIHELMLEEYEVSPDALETDILAFVSQLQAAGLVCEVQNQ